MSVKDLSPALSHKQQGFADALLDMHATAHCMAFFACAEPLAIERLALYRGNLTAIWRQALANAYPVLLQLVGDDYFMQMARSYGLAHPSDTGDLNEFGALLADFLESSGAADDYPYFPDVARLEWALHRCYYAKDETPLTLAQFALRAQQEQRELQHGRLIFCPATCLIRSATASFDIWLAHQTTASAWPEHINQPSYSVIARSVWKPEPHSLSNASWLALDALREGRTLGVAFNRALENDPEFNIAGQLQHWFALDIFSEAQFDLVL